MIKHLFKLIWNKKKQNFLLMSEMLVSFLVIFAVFTLLVYYYNNYKKPMGFEYKNVWLVNYNNALDTKNTDSLDTYYETLRQTVKSMPEIKEISFSSSNIPFSQNTTAGEFSNNNIKAEMVNTYTVDGAYKDVLHMQVLNGRWFNKTDAITATKPVVINSELKEKLFGNTEAVGHVINDYGKNKLKIIGIVQNIKVKGDYAPSGYALYFQTDTGSFHWLGKILINVSPSANTAFEGKLYKTVANFMPASNIEIEHLTQMRKETNYFAVVPMIVLSIVGCFLVINVALGLFGVLWYNINKRRGEIGLRRAIGASGQSVSSQLVVESLILATLSLIVGAFFAVQFPLLNVFNLAAGIYIVAMVLAVIFIYLLVLICSLYPGKQAAAILPAVALHEE
jgi:putative ABC transport system permease protein